MTDTAADPTAPLAGVRVLDLTRMFPGAYCTLMLADLGAEVLKVEAPGFGDGLRFMGETFPASHVSVNRGKRSMTLNLKSQRAGEILRRLVRDADVLVESAKPGQMEKMGVGFEDLRTENPGLIWCALTGFGPDGPNVDAPGHDLTYLGASGLLAQLAAADGTPIVPGLAVTLPVTGLMAAFGIVAALQGRSRTGVGSRVDANMADTGTWMLSEQMVAAANGPVQSWGTMAQRNNYRCADGKWITCTASEPRAWAAVVEATGLAELADYQMGSDEPMVIGKLQAVFAAHPQAHWLANPGLAGGIGPVRTPADLVDDPQTTAREGLPAISGAGDGYSGTRALANPLRIDLAKGADASHGLTPPPDLGADTDAALAAAGYSADAIAALHEEQAV
jgi:crotonobetainyl-CoA:carnitine CoA-transferase CaiB-like acyl-CoA transferase